MKITKSFILLLFIVFLSCSSKGETNHNDSFIDASGNSKWKHYRAPDGTFAIKIPDDWKLERNAQDDAWITLIDSNKYSAAKLVIMTAGIPPMADDPPDLKSLKLSGLAEPFFKGWVGAINEQARVEGTGNIYKTRFRNADALRMDVSYYRGDKDDPRTGYGLFLFGKKSLFFITLTGNKVGVSKLESIASTLEIEPR
jgi:hypothetical protein